MELIVLSLYNVEFKFYNITIIVTIYNKFYDQFSFIKLGPTPCPKRKQPLVIFEV